MASVGVFEYDQSGTGAKALANAIAESEVFSLAGGEDTIAAINKYGIASRISYISTGGGAFLEFLEGKSLPGVCILEHRTKQSRLMHRQFSKSGEPHGINLNATIARSRC